MTITIKNRLIPLNFGLNELMILLESVDKDVGAIQALYVIVSKYIDIQYEEVQEYLQANPHVCSYINNLNLPTPEQIDELYKQAVGEIGVSPSDFWSMSEREIDLAYEGYMRRQELSANLTLLALHKAQNKSWDSITLLEDKGYTVGTEQEREKVFSSLGI